MNAFYVTVSIPLLLLLAGFNHAHGLTTFGKSSPNNQQPANSYAVAEKHCTLQTNCSLLKNTTCLKGVCLCGDNRPPINGGCRDSLLGPNHICSKNEDCVDNADCIAIKEVEKFREIEHLRKNPELSICRCQEGYLDTGATCGGERAYSTIPGLLVAVTLLKMIFY